MEDLQNANLYINTDIQVIDAHGHSQPQTSHQFDAGLMEGKRISDGEGIDMIEMEEVNGPPELSFTGRHYTGSTTTKMRLRLCKNYIKNCFRD
ncbi:hypothetical protein EVAR_49299_1 [Eumeta japonica]|uniref:Uncharacterized protein n=1 Tax=Eumeta variegata TaxID=151549 RepID=A0A4C1XMY5_EUMVA|nr:hypothetical protein EVAR_49299_1 [Eumeta japonica]